MAENQENPHLQRSIASGTILKLEIAENYATGNWKSALRSLVSRVRSSESLESAMDNVGWTAPRQFRALVHESLKVADPAQLILDVVRHRETSRRAWRGLMASLVYPSVLYASALVVSLFFSLLFVEAAHTMNIQDWGLRGTEYYVALSHDQRNSLIGATIVTIWVAVLFATIYVIGPKWAQCAIVGGLPLIGRPFRWLCLSELLGRTEQFLRQNMSLREAVQSVERSFHSTGLASVAEALHRRVEEGIPFGRALMQSMLTDGLCRPAIAMLDEGGASIHERIDRVAVLLQIMAAKRCRLLGVVLPPILFLVVGSLMANTFQAYIGFFMPMVSLISALA